MSFQWKIHVQTFDLFLQTCVCVSGCKKCSFFGKFGRLCFFVTSVLRFAFLPYHRRNLIWLITYFWYLLRPLPYLKPLSIEGSDLPFYIWSSSFLTSPFTKFYSSSSKLRLWNLPKRSISHTTDFVSKLTFLARKVSKYGVFSGPYFPYSNWLRENTDQKKLRIWTLFTQWLFNKDSEQGRKGFTWHKLFICLSVGIS